MINYNWKFPVMECQNKGSLEKIVVLIHWIFEAEKNDVKSNIYGTTSLSLPTEENFTPYEKLTKEQVVSWIESILNVEEMKQNLNKKIEELMKPKNIILPPPFNNTIEGNVGLGITNPDTKLEMK